jgi:hypothetical protein
MLGGNEPTRDGVDTMSERRLALLVAVDRYDHPSLRQLAAPSADEG